MLEIPRYAPRPDNDNTPRSAVRTILIMVICRMLIHLATNKGGAAITPSPTRHLPTPPILADALIERCGEIFVKHGLQKSLGVDFEQFIQDATLFHQAEEQEEAARSTPFSSADGGQGKGRVRGQGKAAMLPESCQKFSRIFGSTRIPGEKTNTLNEAFPFLK